MLEARDAVEAELAAIAPTSPEAGSLIRLGLLNYTAAALLMPYAWFFRAATDLQHDAEALAARFGVSFERACHRPSSLQWPGLRGVPFFFLWVNPAGNVSRRFSAAGFPLARYGGSCPRWVVHAAFATPGQGGCRWPGFRTARRSCASRAAWWAPRGLGATRRRCTSSRGAATSATPARSTTRTASTLERAAWDRRAGCAGCRSRAFPPLEHQLALDPTLTSDSSYCFEPKPRG